MHNSTNKHYLPPIYSVNFTCRFSPGCLTIDKHNTGYTLQQKCSFVHKSYLFNTGPGLILASLLLWFLPSVIYWLYGIIFAVFHFTFPKILYKHFIIHFSWIKISMTPAFIRIIQKSCIQLFYHYNIKSLLIYLMSWQG